MISITTPLKHSGNAAATSGANRPDEVPADLFIENSQLGAVDSSGELVPSLGHEIAADLGFDMGNSKAKFEAAIKGGVSSWVSR